MNLQKKKYRRLTAILLCLLLLTMTVPVSAASNSSSVKKDMTRYLRYAKKGYTIIAWSKSGTNELIVYKEANKNSGEYGRLGFGGAIIVNMKKVKSLTAKKKYKTLRWIPVYVKTSGTSKTETGYIRSKDIGFIALDFDNLSSNPTIQKALSYGLSYLGTSFVEGGTSITSGIDCSNFVNQIFKYAGKSMPSWAHTSNLQQVSYDISKKELKAGDLLFYLHYDTYGEINHVGIYLGKGLMLNASGHYGYDYPNGGICIKKINYGGRKPVRYMRLNGF